MLFYHPKFKWKCVSWVLFKLIMVLYKKGSLHLQKLYGAVMFFAVSIKSALSLKVLCNPVSTTFSFTCNTPLKAMVSI